MQLAVPVPRDRRRCTPRAPTARLRSAARPRCARHRRTCVHWRARCAARATAGSSRAAGLVSPPAGARKPLSQV
eukprot:4315168-Prymnesium_polylepis.1